MAHNEYKYNQEQSTAANLTNKPSVVHPIHAPYTDVVEIHWRLKDGSTWIDRRECPIPGGVQRPVSR